MIQAASAYTFEIDDPQAALAELRQQLNGQLSLRKNTAGILQCDPDFIASGVAAYLGRELGFPVVGGTSVGQAVNKASGNLMLTLFVLTSDEVEFTAARTTGLSQDFYGAIERSWKAARGASSDSPKLIIAFPPILEAYAGDSYIDALERLCGKTPVFGSLAVEDAVTTYDRCATLYGGETMLEEMAYLVVCGETAPRFRVSSAPQASILSEAGVITRAENNIVHEINGVRAIDFFERIGLAKNGVLHEGVDFVPFLMTLKDDDGEDGEQQPFVRGLIGFDAQGSAICRGTMYEGASFTFGANSKIDVIDSALDMIEWANGLPSASAALFFSCIVRRMTLGVNFQEELKLMQQQIRPDLPFMISYSGGELGPTAMTGGRVVNRFHNYSLVACLL
jgi:hypothetical protein